LKFLKFSDEDSYKNRIIFYQKRTGLIDAIQMGTRKLNGTPITLGVMDFQFMGGSMGSVMGKKITCLVEYATKNSMLLIIVCSSGGIRMQEGKDFGSLHF
jgi:acetyl-CoA carboxylase carboxyl transferase subunit beta